MTKQPQRPEEMFVPQTPMNDSQLTLAGKIHKEWNYKKIKKNKTKSIKIKVRMAKYAMEDFLQDLKTKSYNLHETISASTTVVIY